jgi:predicted metal-dependent HD superfamily phosphohydrolase
MAHLHEHIQELAQSHVLDLFAQQLPMEYCFHNPQHTVDVVEQAREIALAEGMAGQQIDVVVVAAWFHDVGYVECYQGHEQRSMRIAAEFLHQHGVSEDAIAMIVGCIGATQMPQSPRNLMEAVLCDADLANLGSADFWANSALLRAEQEWYLQTKFDDVEWFNQCRQFCAHHQFHTEYARQRFTGNQRLNSSYSFDHPVVQHSLTIHASV